MADPAKDAAIRKRIITHMNADHQSSLSLYLQHYLSLPPRTASYPELTSISLSALTLETTDGKTHTIPFTPPMTSYAEARARAVAMDHESRTGLGLSTIKITTYIPPSSPFHLTVAILVLIAYATFLTHSRITPGTFLYDKILPFFPGGAPWFLWISRTIALPVLAIHVTETVIMERTRLRRYNVERWSGVWWKWMVGTFVEGFGSFQRFDGVVEGKKH
jgi:hypothetical protein